MYQDTFVTVGLLRCYCAHTRIHFSQCWLLLFVIFGYFLIISAVTIFISKYMIHCVVVTNLKLHISHIADCYNSKIAIHFSGYIVGSVGCYHSHIRYISHCVVWYYSHNCIHWLLLFSYQYTFMTVLFVNVLLFRYISHSVCFYYCHMLLFSYQDKFLIVLVVTILISR